MPVTICAKSLRFRRINYNRKHACNAHKPETCFKINDRHLFAVKCPQNPEEKKRDDNTHNFCCCPNLLGFHDSFVLLLFSPPSLLLPPPCLLPRSLFSAFSPCPIPTSLIDNTLLLFWIHLIFFFLHNSYFPKMSPFSITALKTRVINQNA